MRFSLRLNNDLSPGEFCELAEVAEQVGFDQLWVSNDLLLHSATVLLTAAATRTSRIALGCGIFNPYTIHPAELAMTAASLQEISSGRFLLGIAAGARQFLEWVGVAQDRPLATTRSAVESVRALTSHRRVRGTRVDRSGVSADPLRGGSHLPRRHEPQDAGAGRRDRRRSARRSSTPPSTSRLLRSTFGSVSIGPGATRPRSICPPACGPRSTMTPRLPRPRWPRRSPTTAPRSPPTCSAGLGLRRKTSQRSTRRWRSATRRGRYRLSIRAC